MDLANLLSPSAFAALLEILAIDIVLAGDNAIVVGALAAGLPAGSDEIVGDEHSGTRAAKTFASAAWGVALADVSMSLDNVLAVAGAARDHPWVLVFGLILSVLLMGVAANFIAKYIERYRWIAWVGLVVILWVALKMVWEGAHHVAPVIAPIFA